MQAAACSSGAAGVNHGISDVEFSTNVVAVSTILFIYSSAIVDTL